MAKRWNDTITMVLVGGLAVHYLTKPGPGWFARCGDNGRGFWDLAGRIRGPVWNHQVGLGGTEFETRGQSVGQKI